jgi:hypothetical protein
LTGLANRAPLIRELDPATGAGRGGALPSTMGHGTGDAAGLAPAALTVEITESALVTDLDRAAEVLRQVKGQRRPLCAVPGRPGSPPDATSLLTNHDEAITFRKLS